MLRRTFLGGLVFTAATPALITSQAQAADWDFLGSKRVQGFVDHDRIQVGVGKGWFDRIRLKVVGNDLLIYDLKVKYGNGVVDDFSVRLLIPEGGQTRAINLTGNERRIRYADIWYGKFPDGDGPTYVELYGRR